MKHLKSTGINGYKCDPQVKDIPEKLFLSGSYKYKGEELHIHIHITFPGSTHHKNLLLFRDYLRKHPEESKTYYEYKKQWLKAAGAERFKFTEFKTPYVKRVLKKAKKEIRDLK